MFTDFCIKHSTSVVGFEANVLKKNLLFLLTQVKKENNIFDKCLIIISKKRRIFFRSTKMLIKKSNL